MKNILAFIIFAFMVVACCRQYEPNKSASITFIVSKDTNFLKNLKRIYALGSVKDTIRNPSSYLSNTNKNQIFISAIPISYVADSTIYIIENKNKVNDTLTVLYQRNVDYDGSGTCGYLQSLSSNTKRKSYSTLKKYSLDVSFGTINNYGNSACTVKLTEN